MTPEAAAFLAFGVSFLASVMTGLALIRLRSRIERVSRDRSDGFAVQASHTGDPLRLGGVAILLGLLLGAVTLAGQSSGTQTLLLLASLVPVFAAGLLEDLGYRVSPKRRALAAVVSAGLAVLLLQHWVSRGDELLLDLLMGFAPAGIVLTILVAGLYCHSVNLIDGMNGLAASIIVSAAAGIAIVALAVDQHQIAVLAALLGAGTLGFIVLNWPVSRLFLGDAGAYGLGHLAVWLAISLVALNETVAVPAMLLLLFYPNADLLHTVARRLAEGKAITEPDRMHLHQKVRRGVEVLWLGRDKRHISNPLSTLILMPFIAGPVVAGVLLWNRPVEAWLAFAAFLVAFAAAHVAIMALAKRFRRSLDPAIYYEQSREGAL